MLATCSLSGLPRLPLCSSSLLCVASFCSVGSFSWHLSLPRLVVLFRYRFFFGYSWFLSLAASSVLLPLVFHFAVWLVLRSLSVLLCSFGLAPFSLSGSDVPFTCLGFLILVLGFSVAVPQSFLSCAFAFLSSSRMLLLGRGFGCPVLPSFMYF